MYLCTSDSFHNKKIVFLYNTINFIKQEKGKSKNKKKKIRKCNIKEEILLLCDNIFLYRNVIERKRDKRV